MLSEVNQNDEVINAVPNVSDTEEMDKGDIAALAKIEALTNADFQNSSTVVSEGTYTDRLQFGTHGGSSTYFNKESSDTRFSVNDGVTGTMYVAKDQLTAMKEVFQNKISLKETDLENFYMGSVVTLKDLTVVQTSALLTRTNLKLHDLTTASRLVTQRLAEKAHAAGMDGIEYPSNVTTQPCYALWHNESSGNGIASTASQTPLSELLINGEEAADILVFKMNIPVEK